MSKDLENYTNTLEKYFSNKNLFYFVRDPERALGLEKILPNYHIIHVLNSQYKKYFESIGLNYLCLEDSNQNSQETNTRKIFNSKEFHSYYEKYLGLPNFAQTFKTNPAYEKILPKFNLQSLNSGAGVSRVIEDKLSQFQLLSKVVKFPDTIVVKLSETNYLELTRDFGDSFIIQFQRGHTGSGTFIVYSEAEYRQLIEKRGNYTVKISKMIKGHSYTINAVSTKKGIYIAGLNYQITGEKQLGAKQGTTVGNDWSFRNNINATKEIFKNVKAIGERIYKEGFRGLFGVDFVIDSTGKIFVIEVNARQTASIPLFNKIQIINEEIPLSMIHLLEFLNFELPDKIDDYNLRNNEAMKYSQVFIRDSKEIVVKNTVNMGYYRLQGDNAGMNRVTDEVSKTTIFIDEDRDKSLLYQGYAATIDAVSQQYILILPPANNRQINPGDEVLRLQLKQRSVDENGTVYPWIIETLNSIKNHIQ